MKTERQIINRWKAEGKKWDKLSLKHIESKDSHFKGHVTKDEHITGERTSFVDGWTHALEWVLNKDLNWWDALDENKVKGDKK